MRRSRAWACDALPPQQPVVSASTGGRPLLRLLRDVQLPFLIALRSSAPGRPGPISCLQRRNDRFTGVMIAQIVYVWYAEALGCFRGGRGFLGCERMW